MLARRKTFGDRIITEKKRSGFEVLYEVYLEEVLAYSGQKRGGKDDELDLMLSCGHEVNKTKRKQMNVKFKKKTNLGGNRGFEDLAIVYRWSVNEGPEGLYTNLITNELAERIGLTEPKMYELGMENTQKLYPLVVKNMNEIVSEMVFGDDMPSEMREEFDGILDDTPDDKSMFVMTNEAKIFGAAAMLFEDKLHELAEKFGTDLYILPSSIHECIAVSANMGDPESLAEMVYKRIR